MTVVRSPHAVDGGVTQLPPPVEPSWADLGFAPWAEPLYRFLQPALSLLGLYLIVRLGLIVTTVFAAHLTYGGHLDGPLTAWDGHWYLSVAANWYPSAQASGHATFAAGGFGPVFPALIWVLERLHLTGVEAALLVSFVGGAASVLVVWRLGTHMFDERAGWIGAVLFMLFPGMGISWGVFYCECVGLGLAAGCLLLMLRQRWVWAGVVGALATGTSPMGLALAAAAIVPVVMCFVRGEKPKPLFTLLMIPVGFVAYVGYLGWHNHDALYWWHLQHQAWSASVDFGKSLVMLLVHPWQGGYQGKGWMNWVGLIAVAAAIWTLIKAKPPLLTVVYCGAVFVVLFVSNSLGFKPRLLTWAFPALIAVGSLTRRRGWQPIAIAFAYLMPVVFLAYTTYANYMIQP